ncbi:hypothetical protein EMCRGX_G030714, partial [Ephydatia muelleri]
SVPSPLLFALINAHTLPHYRTTASRMNFQMSLLMLSDPTSGESIQDTYVEGTIPSGLKPRAKAPYQVASKPRAMHDSHPQPSYISLCQVSELVSAQVSGW